MAKIPRRMQQLVDWRAAVQAALLAGTMFLLLNLFMVPYIVGGSAGVSMRLTASILLGPDILAPPADFTLMATLIALLVHYAISLASGLLLAYIIHRGGLIAGILVGALFGAALYFINFYTFTVLFPWFFAFRSLPLFLTHMVFGALAGGLYEALEVEEFVPVEDV